MKYIRADPLARKDDLGYVGKTKSVMAEPAYLRADGRRYAQRDLCEQIVSVAADNRLQWLQNQNTQRPDDGLAARVG